jgi:Protein of unknown function (DUF1571)
MFVHNLVRSHNGLCSLAVLIGVGLIASVAIAEEKLGDATLRVADNAAADRGPAAAPAATAPAQPVTAESAVFDLTQKPGEHPLMPVIRVVKATQAEFDAKVKDYSCTFIKQERADGELGEEQKIMMKIMQQPFSVYMQFLQPYAGREVAWVEGQNSGRMVVLEAGFKRMMGKMNLDPNGSLAMKGQKHPITDVGIRNLTVKLQKMWEAETKFAECDVTSDPNSKIGGRSCTMIQVVHPIARQDFKFHAARLFLDNELKIPVHFDAFVWPEQENSDPPLEERFTYANLKINNGFTAREFDAKNNPEIFKQ